MKSLARGYFWWPSLDTDIELMVNSYSICMKEKQNPRKSTLHVWEYPSEPWFRIHVDFLGPFYSNIFLVLEDAYSKWIDVKQVPSTAASHTIKYLTNVFSVFGLPHLVCDNGPPFHSVEFQNFLKAKGIKQLFSPPYHPQTNGQAENCVKIIKRGIKKAVSEGKDINSALQISLFNYRNAPHCTTGVKPSFLLLNRNLRTKFDLILPDVNTNVMLKQGNQIKNARGVMTFNGGTGCYG